jgi:hypothetical protein
MLEQLQGAGLPVVAGRATRAQSAVLYGRCQVSFNASLNGDLNMRVLEVLSAGGCLLTDRLSPVSGMRHILEEGREYLAYGDGDELLAQARRLLGDPAHAAAVAQAGHRRYMAELRQDHQIARLLAWAAGAEISPLHRAVDDPRVLREPGAPKLTGRMRVYENVQETHRRQENPRVRIQADLPEDSVLDLADLPRLTLCIAGHRPDAPELAARARRIGATVEIGD